MKLMALNLPRSFSEDALAKLFKKHGNIKSCKLILDEKTGKSKGFGFIEMALKHEGIAAIEKLHGIMIEKNKIRVKQAN